MVSFVRKSNVSYRPIAASLACAIGRAQASSIEACRFDDASVGRPCLGEIPLALVGLPEKQIVTRELYVLLREQPDRAGGVAEPERDLAGAQPRIAAHVRTWRIQGGLRRDGRECLVHLRELGFSFGHESPCFVGPPPGAPRRPRAGRGI